MAAAKHTKGSPAPASHGSGIPPKEIETASLHAHRTGAKAFADMLFAIEAIGKAVPEDTDDSYYTQGDRVVFDALDRYGADPLFRRCLSNWMLCTAEGCILAREYWIPEELLQDGRSRPAGIAASSETPIDARPPQATWTRDADSMLASVRRARHALSVWTVSSPVDEERPSRGFANVLQVTARAINEELCSARDLEDEGLDLLYAEHLVGMVEAALWRSLSMEGDAAPPIDALVSTMEMACARLDEFMARHDAKAEPSHA